MKHFLFLLALATPLVSVAAPNVGVSVRLGQPGFYGQIEMGGMPPPQLVYPAPVVIQPVPVGVVGAPIYLRVPPGHYQNWRHYCGRYNACGRPVYFVNDGWYRNTYVPRYQNNYRHAYPAPYYRNDEDRHQNQHYYNDHKYNR
ncbi:hypothetical protein AAKU67_001354 [Oxalobacteraceae bacterium GrIS 2.11]